MLAIKEGLEPPPALLAAINDASAKIAVWREAAKKLVIRRN
jgi:hypothetical protein